MYCAGNPVKYIDPDGRKIVFAEGVSAEFKAQFKEAIQHLNKHKQGGIASYLEKSNITYTIAETQGTNVDFRSNSSSNTITWNPNLGLETDEGVVLSPTTVLNHEFAHALTYDAAVSKGKLTEFYGEAAENSDPDYGTKCDRWVITRSEQRTAKALGEIKEGQVTRKNHGGRLVRTEGPTSNQKVVPPPEVRMGE
jgi:hypothetical protein